MATGMGFFSKFRSSGSPEARALAELAAVAGQSQRLVERLRRHAARCDHNIRTGVEKIAERETGHVKALGAILQERNVWSKLPEPPLHDGSNNWARLGGDLEVLVELISALRVAAVRWEGVDQAIADRLMAISIEDEAQESDLRKLALKCDPLALD